jgi:hypothetical protein
MRLAPALALALLLGAKDNWELGIGRTWHYLALLEFIDFEHKHDDRRKPSIEGRHLATTIYICQAI